MAEINFRLIAQRYGWKYRTLLSKLKPIRPELDAMQLNLPYRILTQKQIDRIEDYLGKPVGKNGADVFVVNNKLK